MSISMHRASVPPCVNALNALAGVLRKGAAHADAKGIDPAVFVSARLYPDMLPLSSQVQIATDVAKGCGARLAGREPPRYADDETTLDQLIERIENTVAFLEECPQSDIDGSEDRSITLKTRRGEMTFNGLDYLTGFVLPNVYFHVTTAYNILRHNGVELGKADYLGRT